MDSGLLSDDDELVVAGPPAQPESCLPSTLDLIGAAVRRWFPTIHHMTPVELATRLAQVPPADGPDTDAYSNSGAQLVLLDVREPAEFAVSHIPGAVNVCPSAHKSPDDVMTILASVGPQSDSSAIVCYCSVGFRSSQLALAIATVEQRWLGRVHNLDGSIFRWASQGRQLVDQSGKPTESVHPYSSLWGNLISADLHSWEQPSSNSTRRDA